MLSAGPETLGPLASSPGLVDEYLLVVHPAVLAAGPRLFDHLTHDLALDLIHAEVFDAGAIIAALPSSPARMIARVWRGVAASNRLADYVDYVDNSGVDAYRPVPGNQAAHILTRDLGDGKPSSSR